MNVFSRVLSITSLMLFLLMVSSNSIAAGTPVWKKVVPGADGVISTITQDHLEYSGHFEGYTHFGVDIAAPELSKIYPMLPGYVIEISDNDIQGHGIMLDHGSNLYTIMLHMIEPPAANGTKLKEGDYVNAVTSIGKIGNTGIANGYHTHFEIRHFYDPNLAGGWYHEKSKNSAGTKLNMYACKDVSKTSWALNDWEDPETYSTLNVALLSSAMQILFSDSSLEECEALTIAGDSVTCFDSVASRQRQYYVDDNGVCPVLKTFTGDAPPDPAIGIYIYSQSAVDFINAGFARTDTIDLIEEYQSCGGDVVAQQSAISVSFEALSGAQWTATGNVSNNAANPPSVSVSAITLAPD
jgi:murein DD-endopeptidase MepM/ murein hydrolase activator NlpD